MLSGPVLLGTGAHDQLAIAEPACRSTAPSCPSPPTPTGCSFATTPLPEGLAPVLGVLAELLAERPTPTTGSRASGAGSPSGSRSPGPSRVCTGPRRPRGAPYGARTRTPSRPPTTGSSRPSTAVRCASCTGSGPARREQPRPGRRPGPAGRDRRGRGCARRLVGTGTPCEALPPVPEPACPESRSSTGRMPCSRNLRLGGVAPGGTDPDLAAVRLANLIFGGYFSSRSVENIREGEGYTYSPTRARSTRWRARRCPGEADVATEVTGRGAPGNLVRAGPDGPHHRDRGRARRRAALRPRQHGPVDRDARRPGQHPLGADRRGAAGGRLAETSRRWRRSPSTRCDDVSLRYLAAEVLTAVVVGDSGRIAGQLRALAPVESRPGTAGPRERAGRRQHARGQSRPPSGSRSVWPENSPASDGAVPVPSRLAHDRGLPVPAAPGPDRWPARPGAHRRRPTGRTRGGGARRGRD